MRISWIQKQSGHLEGFDMQKLARSIESAFRHAGKSTSHEARGIAHEVRTYLEGQRKEIVGADGVRQAVMYILTHHRERDVKEAYELTSLHLQKVPMHGVMKRGGRVEPFHPLKLFKSIKKSFRDAGLSGGKMAEALTHEISEGLERDYQGVPVPFSEIQRRTALLLKKKGFGAAEKMYLLHKYM